MKTDRPPRRYARTDGFEVPPPNTPAFISLGLHHNRCNQGRCQGKPGTQTENKSTNTDFPATTYCGSADQPSILPRLGCLPSLKRMVPEEVGDSSTRKTDCERFSVTIPKLENSGGALYVL